MIFTLRVIHSLHDLRLYMTHAKKWQSKKRLYIKDFDHVHGDTLHRIFCS